MILKQKLANIKLVVMDVDGTMTDGGLYYNDNGLVMKKFNAKDGMGITLLNQSNIQSAIITSDNSNIPIARAERLNITHCIINAKPKLQHFLNLLDKLKITPEQAAFIGDDINDLEILTMCGIAACTADAHHSVKSEANFISKFNGGCGAVRQLCDEVLLAQNLPISLL